MRKRGFSKTHTLSSVGILIAKLFIGIFLFSFLPKQAQADPNQWYDTDWGYRRAITIDNTGNADALTDYQIKIAVTSANLDFDKIQPDGSDIRVTDSNGTTLIPYFIADYNSVAETATI